MRGGLNIWMAVVLVGACGDDGVGSDSSAGETEGTSTGGPTTSSTTATGSTTTTTATSEGSSGESSSSTDPGSESGSGSGSSEGSSGSGSSGSGSETSSVCNEIETVHVDAIAFSGDDACDSPQANAVLEDPMAVSDHNEAYCDAQAACMDPDPACPPLPDLDLDGFRVVYVRGQTSGCSASAMISSVLDCGDEVEVHYVVAPIGPCGLIVYAWDAVVIPDGASVTFIEDA